MHVADLNLVGFAVIGLVVRVELADEGGHGQHLGNVIGRVEEHRLGREILLLAVIRRAGFLRGDQTARHALEIDQLLDGDVARQRALQIRRVQSLGHQNLVHKFTDRNNLLVAANRQHQVFRRLLHLRIARVNAEVGRLAGQQNAPVNLALHFGFGHFLAARRPFAVANPVINEEFRLGGNVILAGHFAAVDHAKAGIAAARTVTRGWRGTPPDKRNNGCGDN